MVATQPACFLLVPPRVYNSGQLAWTRQTPRQRSQPVQLPAPLPPSEASLGSGLNTLTSWTKRTSHHLHPGCQGHMKDTPQATPVPPGFHTVAPPGCSVQLPTQASPAEPGSSHPQSKALSPGTEDLPPTHLLSASSDLTRPDLTHKSTRDRLHTGPNPSQTAGPHPPPGPPVRFLANSRLSREHARSLQPAALAWGPAHFQQESPPASFPALGHTLALGHHVSCCLHSSAPPPTCVVPEKVCSECCVRCWWVACCVINSGKQDRAGTRAAGSRHPAGHPHTLLSLSASGSWGQDVVFPG